MFGMKSRHVWRRNCGVLVLAGWTSVLGNAASPSARSEHFESELKEPFDLGRMYFTGEGALQDLAGAVRLFRLAADQGHADAQTHLGGCTSLARGSQRT